MHHPWQLDRDARVGKEVLVDSPVRHDRPYRSDIQAGTSDCRLESVDDHLGSLPPLTLGDRQGGQTRMERLAGEPSRKCVLLVALYRLTAHAV